MTKIKFPDQNSIIKPLKFKFKLFTYKSGNRYFIKDNNFLRDLDIYDTKLLLTFVNQKYLKAELNYIKYIAKDFREMQVRISQSKVKEKIARLKNKGLVKINEDGFIAYNYIYQKKEHYVQLPNIFIDLIKQKVIKRSEIKVLFAILLLMYSYIPEGGSINNMGTDRLQITIARIQKLTNISVQTIKRTIKKLKTKGVIDYEVRYGDNSGNLFKIEYDYNTDVSCIITHKDKANSKVRKIKSNNTSKKKSSKAIKEGDLKNLLYS